MGLVATARFRTLRRMYGWAVAVLVLNAWLLFAQAAHAQSAQAAGSPQQSASSTSKSAGTAKRLHMEIEHSSNVCSELSEEECCAQMLEIALFRATGDQVPRKAKLPVRLSCQDPNHTIPENACRLIAMGRGLSAQDAADVCAPAGLVKRCTSDTACRQCIEDLSRLSWKGAARACHALTYLPKVTQGTRVVTFQRR
jgi:hypothetical protein